MKPFFCYYGGKFRSAPHYPAPMYGHIIEPFAGAAGYATRYYQHKVTLCEINPKVAALWRFLIRSKPSEILGIPAQVEHVDCLKTEEHKYLVGFWLNKGASTPCKTPSSWMRGGTRPNSYWGQTIRERIASQVNQIKHWSIRECDFQNIPNFLATWFIDPPYTGNDGKLYTYNKVNYSILADFVKTRNGQSIACEQNGAEWLPFSEFRACRASPSKRGGKICHEVIFENHRDIDEIV